MQVMQSHTQMSPAQKYEPDSPCFFRIVKEQPKQKQNRDTPLQAGRPDSL